ncbi:pogo transposable element with KRAB domain-like, partial [Brachionus plicatilis]
NILGVWIETRTCSYNWERSYPCVSCFNNVVVVYGTNGNFNELAISSHYIDKVIKPYMIVNGFEKVNLLIDCAPCHCTPTVKNAFEAANIDITYVPKRLTNLLQPADIAWFRPLKSSYNEFWTDWLLNADKTYTKSNNVRSPGYALIIQWVSSIWEQFDKMIIQNSFDQAGITSNIIDLFHRQLRHFIFNQEFIDDVEDDNAQDLNAFISGDEANIHDLDLDDFDDDEDDEDNSDTEMA